MDERDFELDALLEPLRREPINPFFARRWRLALERRHPRLHRWVARGSQLAVATAAGFAMGLYVAKAHTPAENYSTADATIEQIFVKAQ